MVIGRWQTTDPIDAVSAELGPAPEVPRLAAPLAPTPHPGKHLVSEVGRLPQGLPDCNDVERADRLVRGQLLPAGAQDNVEDADVSAWQQLEWLRDQIGLIEKQASLGTKRLVPGGKDEVRDLDSVDRVAVPVSFARVTDLVHI